MSHTSHRHHHHSSRPTRPGFFLRMKLKYRLWRWAKKMKLEGHSGLYVKRRYDYTRVYIDLYMNVHRKSDGARIAAHDTRCDWFELADHLQMFENKVLTDLNSKP